MNLKILDSRRLTGPNLLSSFPGAIIDVEIAGHAVEEVVNTWEEQVKILLDSVSWGSENVFVRSFKNGASLAFSAPVDALYAATDLNEAAFERTSAVISGNDPPDIAATVSELRRTIAAESNPQLLRLKAKAAEQAVGFLSDDDRASIGMGAGSQTWDVSKLPDPESLDWSKVHNIPLALITGTNGKSTTVRILESILKAAGKRPGITSTDYIRVDGEILDKGDYSGTGGARTILRDKRVEVAVLEVARGSILRRGLGVPKADVALIANVAEDHLNQYGIDSLDDLIAAKFVINRAVENGGVLVLNADDDGLVRYAKILGTKIFWFGIDSRNPQILSHLDQGGHACIVRNDKILYISEKGEETIIAIDGIPITMNGAARHNISNSLGAVAVAKALGVATAAIATGLSELQGDPKDNPGRGNYFDVKGARVLVDFAHNVHGMSAIVETVKSFPARRRLILLGLAGDRTDEEIRGLARAGWEIRPDKVIITEVPEYLRGKDEGVLPALIADELRSCGARDEILAYSSKSFEGVKMAIDWAQEGDFLLLLVHSQRDEALEFLEGLSA